MTPRFGDGFDPFIWFRWLLAIFGTTYAVVMTGRGVWRVVLFFSGRGRGKTILRRVLAVQLLRMRVRCLAGELAQIGLLVAALVLCLWLHRHLGFISP